MNGGLPYHHFTLNLYNCHTFARDIDIHTMAVFLSVLSMLPYIVQSSQHMNHSRMAIWCKAPITSESRDILDSMAANISFHFNISVEIEILNLNYSAYNVYHILDGIESKRESKTKNEMFVVSNIGLKESWLWAKILGNSESVIVDIQHPKQEEISKSQVSFVILLCFSDASCNFSGDLRNMTISKEIKVSLIFGVK